MKAIENISYDATFFHKSWTEISEDGTRSHVGETIYANMPKDMRRKLLSRRKQHDRDDVIGDVRYGLNQCKQHMKAIIHMAHVLSVMLIVCLPFFYVNEGAAYYFKNLKFSLDSR